MYRGEIHHEGLNKFRVIRGETQEEVKSKAAWQLKAWDEQWQRVQQAQAHHRKRERDAHSKELRKALAEQQTNEAQEAIRKIEVLLRDGGKRDSRVDWSKLIEHTNYPEPKPSAPTPQTISSEPLRMAFPP